MLVFTPQPSFHFRQQSPRQRYLQALAEEQAARNAYARDIVDQYSNPFGHCSYEDEREARVREYYRQQQLAATRVAHQRQEEQRRQHMLEQQRLAHLERENAFAHILGQMVHTSQQQNVSVSAGVEPQSIPRAQPEAQPARLAPTWQQKQDAASMIQSSFRKHLVRKMALSQLATLRQSFASTKDSFTFPAVPEFDSDSSTPRLLYTAYNAPIHSFEDSLIKLLSRLDEVESAGDVEIRKARKALAREIEACLEQVDRTKEDAWRTQRAASDLTALPSAASEMQDIVAAEAAPIILEVFDSESQGLPEKVALVDDANATVIGHPNATTIESNDCGSPLADIEMVLENDTSPILDAPETPEPEAGTPGVVLSSKSESPSDLGPEIPTDDESQPLSTPSGVEGVSSLPEEFSDSDSAPTHELKGESSSTSDHASSSGSSSPQLDDTFLSRPFDAPGSASVLMASLPVLNDDMEQKEVEDIVFVDAEALLDVGHNYGDAERRDGPSEAETDDFVMVQ